MLYLIIQHLYGDILAKFTVNVVSSVYKFPHFTYGSYITMILYLFFHQQYTVHIKNIVFKRTH